MTEQAGATIVLDDGRQIEVGNPYDEIIDRMLKGADYLRGGMIEFTDFGTSKRILIRYESVKAIREGGST
jgi:hypothetical protein